MEKRSEIAAKMVADAVQKPVVRGVERKTRAVGSGDVVRRANDVVEVTTLEAGVILRLDAAEDADLALVLRCKSANLRLVGVEPFEP